MPASESQGRHQDPLIEMREFSSPGLYDRVARFLSKLLWRIFTPSRWLLQKLDKSEGELRGHLQSASRVTWVSWWIAVQLVRLVSLVVVLGERRPYLYRCLDCLRASLLGGFEAVFLQRMGRRALDWGRSLVALVPKREPILEEPLQYCRRGRDRRHPPISLSLRYNGFIDGEMTPPHVLQEAIKAYEHAAVWMYQALEPVREISWFWWVLGGVGLLFLTYVSESHRLFAAALWLRGLLASFVFVVAVTTSFSLSSSIRVWNWEPDMNRRLQAAFKETVTHETELNLAEALKDWFSSHKDAQTALPGYVRSFEKALRELGQRRDDQGRQDLWKGARTAMKALVPKDLDAEPGSSPDLQSWRGTQKCR